MEWGAEIISEDEVHDDGEDDALEAAVEAGHEELVQMLSTSSQCLSDKRLDNVIRCVIGLTIISTFLVVKCYKGKAKQVLL